MKKFMVCIILVSLLFLAWPAWASGEVPTTLRITVSPLWGLPGTAIAVTGIGAHPDKPVHVALATTGEGGMELAGVDVAPNLDGTFQASIIIPAGTADGRYYIRAHQINPRTGGRIHYWYVGISVGAAAPPLPVTGGIISSHSRTNGLAGGILLLFLLGATLSRYLKTGTFFTRP